MRFSTADSDFDRREFLGADGVGQLGGRREAEIGFVHDRILHQRRLAAPVLQWQFRWAHRASTESFVAGEGHGRSIRSGGAQRHRVDGTGGRRARPTSPCRTAASPPSAASPAPGARRSTPSGLAVTPGFVDIHTHYDGQATWDQRFVPSSRHGVTTVVMGNCGVGFAPCRPQDRDRLIKLMEGVEDIPELGAARGRAVELGELPRLSRRAWRRAASTSTSPPRCRTRRCASSSWAGAASTASPRPRPTSPPWRRSSRRACRPARSASPPRARCTIARPTARSRPPSPPARRSWRRSPAAWPRGQGRDPASRRLQDEPEARPSSPCCAGWSRSGPAALLHPAANLALSRPLARRCWRRSTRGQGATACRSGARWRRGRWRCSRAGTDVQSVLDLPELSRDRGACRWRASSRGCATRDAGAAPEGGAGLQQSQHAGLHAQRRQHVRAGRSAKLHAARQPSGWTRGPPRSASRRWSSPTTCWCRAMAAPSCSIPAPTTPTAPTPTWRACCATRTP